MLRFIFIIFSFLVPFQVFASTEGGGGSLMSMDMLFKAINFLILLILLHIFAKKPLKNMLSTSAKNTKVEFEESKKEVEAIRQELEDYNKKFNNIDQELSESREKILASLEDEKKRNIEETNKLIKTIEKQSELQIEQDILKAKNEIRNFLADESVKLAEKLVTDQMNSSKQDSLMSDYVKVIKKTG